MGGYRPVGGMRDTGGVTASTAPTTGPLPSPLLDLPGAVSGDGIDAPVAAHYGSFNGEQRMTALYARISEEMGWLPEDVFRLNIGDMLGKAFGDAGVHARSAVGVSALPLDAPVEVEMIVALAEDD